MQPFTIKTLYALLLAALAYYLTDLLFNGMIGIGWIFARSFVFLMIYATGALAMKLSPDIRPVLDTIRKKLRF
jgi:hypothetical protein